MLDAPHRHRVTEQQAVERPALHPPALPREAEASGRAYFLPLRPAPNPGPVSRMSLAVAASEASAGKFKGLLEAVLLRFSRTTQECSVWAEASGQETE